MGNIKEDVERELYNNDIEDLEKLSEWWMEHKYNSNIWESENEYNKRRDMVLPMIIGCKLDKYEEEYA